MSVEALLAEVTPIVGLRPVLEAAESAYFHDRRALSDVKPETSHAGGHHGNQHHGGKGDDKVADAINDAKEALNKAKKGGAGRNRHGSNKSESEDVSALRKELAELKLGYKSLTQELADLRKLVQKHYPLQQFLHIGNRVLVLGDGNLSFSLSLARLLPDISVTATVLEPEDLFYRAYPKGIMHVERLRELPNVEIVFGVDARRIPHHWKDKFTDILMNHPHQGGKTNVKKSKMLMKEILMSIRQFLDDSETRFHLTLMSKQAGLDIDEIRDGRTFLDHQPNHYRDSWQIAYLAAEAELMIERIDIFLPGLFSEYISAGFRNRDHPFYQRSEPIKMSGGSSGSKPTATSAPAKEEAGEDEDFDLFGSEDEDDEEKKRITEERLKAYAEKKAKKPGPIAKSTIIYDVKPWDDTISTDDIEKAVRGIEMDGLVWGASKKVPIAYGIVKLQISCVIEDDKVSSDALEEAITGFEDLVQSIDVVAFNKV